MLKIRKEKKIINVEEKSDTEDIFNKNNYKK